MNKRNYYRRMERMKIRTAKEYVNTFFYALRVQKAPVLKQVREHGPITALIYIDQMSPEPIFKAYQKLYNNVGAPIAEAEYRRLKRVPETKAGFGYSIDWLAEIADYLDNFMLDQVVLPMTARTMDRMRNIVTQGIASGDSLQEMTDKLEDTEVDRVRATLIARTETNNAVNFSTNLAANNYGFKVEKEWLSALDRRTRGNPIEGQHDKADHWDMNGQKADAEGLFTDPRNGAKMLFPGDHTHGAPAASICNCRCNLLQNPIRDANGDLVPK